MNPADKERLLARIAERPLTPHHRVLCEYRLYLGEVTDCWTLGGLILDVCGTGWWICVPEDGKEPRWSKRGLWRYQRGEGELLTSGQPLGILPLVERMLDLDHLHGGHETLFVRDWDVARHYIEQF